MALMIQKTKIAATRAAACHPYAQDVRPCLQPHLHLIIRIMRLTGRELPTRALLGNKDHANVSDLVYLALLRA